MCFLGSNGFAYNLFFSPETIFSGYLMWTIRIGLLQISRQTSDGVLRNERCENLIALVLVSQVHTAWIYLVDFKLG